MSDIGDHWPAGPTFQKGLAHHVAAWRAARLLVLDAFTTAEAAVAGGDELTPDAAGRHAGGGGLRHRRRGECAQWAHLAAGTSAIREGSRLERAFRDIYTGTQHAFISEKVAIDSAQVWLGIIEDSSRSESFHRTLEGIAQDGDVTAKVCEQNSALQRRDHHRGEAARVGVCDEFAAILHALQAPASGASQRRNAASRLGRNAASFLSSDAMDANGHANGPPGIECRATTCATQASMPAQETALSRAACWVESTNSS